MMCAVLPRASLENLTSDEWLVQTRDGVVATVVDGGGQDGRPRLGLVNTSS